MACLWRGFDGDDKLRKEYGKYVVGILIVVLIGVLFFSRPGSEVLENGEIVKDEMVFKFVSGTEYVPTDEGQVIVELRDRQYNSINATCYVSILYPNKTLFVNHQEMADTASVGTQYYNFTVPTVSGVFEYSANCTYLGNNYIVGQSFHVSKGRLKAWMER